MDPDVEAKARAIVLAARGERRPLPRWIWTTSLVLSVLCVAALAIAWFEDRNTAPLRPLDHHAVEHQSGLWLGLLVGLGLGIAIGSVMALRHKRVTRRD
ncbi:MAG: hypothetical protein ABI591_33930 [Kofleriaceae bacterium]